MSQRERDKNRVREIQSEKDYRYRVREGQNEKGKVR